MAQEDIEEVDDSEHNKSDPGKTQEEKEPNFGCSEIKVTDESESNKAGPSRTKQEKEPKFDSATSKRAGAVEYIRYEVDELRSQVAVLRSQIDNIRSQIDDHRTRSRSPSSIPRHVAIARTIARLTGQTRFGPPPEEPVSQRPFSTPHPNRREPGRLSSTLEIIPQDEDMPEASTPRPNRRNRREPRRFSPTLAIVPEDEDMPEEEEQGQAPKSPVGDFLISDLRPGSSSSKGKSVDSSSQQYRGGRAGPRRMDDDISLELADKIAADQLMLYEDIDLLLSQVRNLTDQALQLKTQADGGPQSCKPESKASSTRDEDELKLSRAVRRLEITNKTDPASLDRRNIELVHKATHLESQVKDLQSLVNELRSKLRSPNNHGDRTRGDGLRYQYSEQRERSSPTRERTTKTESSSSASQEQHGKSIRMGCVCFGSPHKNSGKSD